MMLNRNQRALSVHRRARTLSILFTVVSAASAALAQIPDNSLKRYAKDGLAFDYAAEWELSDQSTESAQQLVLIDKTLDAQVMIVVLRGLITSTKQYEAAIHAVTEPLINNVMKQYVDAGVAVERAKLHGEVGGNPTEGLQLRFNIDGHPGTNDILWLKINKRLVNVFFITPEKTSAQTRPRWDTIRESLRVEKVATAKDKTPQ